MNIKALTLHCLSLDTKLTRVSTIVSNLKKNVIMKPTYHYSTVLEALSELKENGFHIDFNFHNQAILAKPTHYSIAHIYRYEGDSDPDEEAVVYGIISQNGQKGYYVAGFSANSDDKLAELLQKIIIE